MVFALLLSLAGIGALCALLFNAAVYALPVVVGIWTLQITLQTSMGTVGAITAAIVAGALTYGLGQVVFETSRSMPLRIAVALLFVVPAVFAGYSTVMALSGLGMSSGVWRQVFSIFGALCVGGTAFVRLVGQARVRSNADLG